MIRTKEEGRSSKKRVTTWLKRKASMDTSRILLLVLVLIFLFVSPESQRPSQSQQVDLYREVISEQQAFNLLNTTSYEAFDSGRNLWINITGLRREDGYAWGLLPQVQERVREQIHALFDGIPSNSPLGTSYSSLLDNHEKKSNGHPNNFSTVWNTRYSVYKNVTGTIRGQWTQSNIGQPSIRPVLNLTALAPDTAYSTKQYNRNITGHEGKLRLKLDEKSSELLVAEAGTVREIHAEMIIKDEGSSGDGWEMTLHGLHYPEQGGIILVTTSPRFAGIFALPHFTLSKTSFSLAQQLFNRTLGDVIIEQQNSNSASMNPWSSSPNNPSELYFPTPHCEFIVYLQQHPINFANDELSMIEKELRYPTGALLPKPPAMKMSTLIFSPDCGFVLESKGPPDFTLQQGTHLVGEKLESYMRQARHGILAFASIMCCEIFLLIRQMKETSTPSTRSRVSFYTVGIMALGDGFACMGFMVVSMFFEAAFLPLISTAFITFLCVSFFGMKFLMDIWTVQAPERLERQRRIAAASPVAVPATVPPTTQPTFTPVVITAAGVDTLPLPVTARRPTVNDNTPIIITPDQDLDAAEADDAAAAQPTAQTAGGSARREMGALYSRFYFLLLGIVFVSVHATSWPTVLRSIYTNILTFTYLSFWVPQIHRNIIRNCRKALRWEFVLGQSILRLAPLIYFYTIDQNILFVDNDQNAAYILVGWVWIQLWVLASQEILGPRFFVPNGWAPPAYDYHPVFHDSDQENGTLPIGFTQATADPDRSDAPSVVDGGRSFDCAICMQNLEVPVVNRSGGEGGDGGGGGGGGLASTIFSRRAYMVTPCRHVFHTPCLEGWMRYRLQCPICRNNLPPL